MLRANAFLLLPGQPPIKMRTLDISIGGSIFTSGEDGFKIGLMFTDLPAEAVALIDRFVKS